MNTDETRSEKAQSRESPAPTSLTPTENPDLVGITFVREKKNAPFRRILFVEDRHTQLIGVSMMLNKTGMWDVKVVETPKLAYDELSETSRLGQPIPDVVSIDLGLADKPEEADHGLALLEKIRKRWKGLPLVVHGTMVKVHEDIVRTIVARGASYFYLGDDTDAQAYVMMLPYIAQGYIVYSPAPAARLPRIVTVKPDPFAKNPEYWETAKLLSEGKRYTDVARLHTVTEDAIKARVKRMAMRLEALDEIDPLPDPGEDTRDDRYKSQVVEWYRRNRFRYGR